MNAVIASLAQRAARHFPSPAVVAGFQLLAGDRVALAGVSPDGADASVKSKRARSVRLRRHGDALGVACTCWPNSAEVGACKHVWAALLAVDRDGGLDALRATPKPVALVPLAAEATAPATTKAKALAKAKARAGANTKTSATAKSCVKSGIEATPAKAAPKSVKKTGKARRG